MSKLALGPRKYRYTIIALTGLYMISAILGSVHIGMEIGLLHKFPFTIFSLTLQTIAMTCFGILVLNKQQGLIMRIYGKLLIFLLVLHIVGLIMLIFVIIKRQTIINDYLKELMTTYRPESDNLLDAIQNNFQCCGRKSDDDWIELPPISCCKDCSNPYFHRIYHEKGCLAVLSSISAYILMAYGLLTICHIILHVSAIKSAFELAKCYEQEVAHALANQSNSMKERNLTLHRFVCYNS